MRCQGSRSGCGGSAWLEQILQNRAQRIHVASLVEASHFSARLLGRHVPRRPKNRAVRGNRWIAFLMRVAGFIRPRCGFEPAACAQTFRYAPVHNQHFTERPEHDVFRLQIAMENAHARVQRLRRRIFAEISANDRGSDSRSRESRSSRSAFHEFHRVENAPVCESALRRELGRCPDARDARGFSLRATIALQVLRSPQEHQGSSTPPGARAPNLPQDRRCPCRRWRCVRRCDTALRRGRGGRSLFVNGESRHRKASSFGH